MFAVMELWEAEYRLGMALAGSLPISALLENSSNAKDNRRRPISNPNCRASQFPRLNMPILARLITRLVAN